MSLLLVAIAPEPVHSSLAPDLRWIQEDAGGPFVAVRGLDAAVPAGGTRDESALGFALLIAELHRGSSAMLPLRFGATAASESEVAERLRRFGGTWRQRLSAVRGCDEFGIVVEVAAPQRAANGGRAHLARVSERIAAQAKAQLHADEAFARLQPLSREQSRQRSGLPWGSEVALAFLVQRSHSRAFRREVAAFCEERPAERIRMSGPWAPYSFASDGPRV